MSAFRAVTTTDMQKRSARWRQNTGAAPADCGQRSTHRHTRIGMNPTALSSLGRLRSIPLTARRRCALKKRIVNVCVYISNNITLENRNYDWQSGVLPSCRGALAGGKLWVKARRAATFIDSQVHCLKAVGIPHSDFFALGLCIWVALILDQCFAFQTYASRRGLEATWRWHIWFWWLTMENNWKRTFLGINWQHNDR